MTVLFLLAAFVYLGIQHRRINRLQQEKQLQSIELSTLRDTVAVYQSKNGELTYKLSVVEVSHRNLKESLETAGFDIKKLKERDIAWRKVTAALRMQLAATGSGTVQLTDTFRIVERDTVNYLAFETWSNNFLTLNNGEIFNRQLTFDYQYRTGIDFLTTGKRRETVVSVILSDPNATITTGNSITVKHEKRIWERGWVWAVVGFAGGVIVSK
jgi:hypothetical protein